MADIRPVANATTFKELLDDFAERLGPDGPAEAGYMAYMKSAASYVDAIDRAVRSRKPNGKMHNHQCKIPLKILLNYGKRIEREFDWWRWHNPGDCPSFNALHNRMDNIKPKGIGPLAVYDISVRLGWWYAVEPTKLYLHAGCRIGVKALGIEIPRGKETLRKSSLPHELRHLSYNELEDFLCAYSRIFPQIEWTMEEEA